MPSELNKVTGIVAGQYGEAIILTIVDSNSIPVDCSTYTTSKTITLRDPFTLKALTYAVTFVTNGADGQITFTPSSGDIDRAGTWEGQVELQSGTGRAVTQLFTVEVVKRLGST